MPSKIEWTDETWPVVTGCSHAGSPGCDSCYAARMAATRLKHHPRYKGLAVIKDGRPQWTGEVRLNHDVLEQPLHWRKPRRVFVCSMSDLFHPSVPSDYIYKVFGVMALSFQHTFQVLTKRPQRMFDVLSHYARAEIHRTNLLGRDPMNVSTWPLSNVWLGVSVENQAAADERIPLLLQTPAAVRFVSVEPTLAGIDLWPYLDPGYYEPAYYSKPNPTLDWVICGGESGPGARPMDPDWPRSLRDQCQAAGTPYFFKQWGAWIPVDQWDATCQEKVTAANLSRVHHWPDGADSLRVSKKRAGRLLDGRTWDEMPEEINED